MSFVVRFNIKNFSISDECAYRQRPIIFIKKSKDCFGNKKITFIKNYGEKRTCRIRFLMFSIIITCYITICCVDQTSLTHDDEIYDDVSNSDSTQRIETRAQLLLRRPRNVAYANSN